MHAPACMRAHKYARMYARTEGGTNVCDAPEIGRRLETFSLTHKGMQTERALGSAQRPCAQKQDLGHG